MRRSDGDRQMLTSWGKLPDYMRTAEVKTYYDVLKKHSFSILIKRLFDFAAALVLLVLLAVPMMIIAIWIKTDSDGPVFYRQERVTKNGKHFWIHKFRTMVVNADKIGTAVTTENDRRITKVGEKLRSMRIDELPQLLDVLQGNMSFVGTRPEAVKYVERYQPEYYATLLMPAGITSEASIRYKDENKLLKEANDVDRVYIEKVLPQKMVWNLNELRQFGLIRELGTMVRTIAAVCGKDCN